MINLPDEGRAGIKFKFDPATGELSLAGVGATGDALLRLIAEQMAGPNAAPRMLPPWTPFVLGPLDPITDAEVEASAKLYGISLEEARRSLEDPHNDTIYTNSRYQVNVRTIEPKPGADAPTITHLSIKRRDKDRIGPEKYRDFLRIKNELCGEDREAVELYPAMVRNVDTANQYHLWVLPAGMSYPIGFSRGVMTSDTTGTKARQHPHGED